MMRRLLRFLGLVADSQPAEWPARPLPSDYAEYRRLRDNCEGFDDPEERCPRSPDDCRCFESRTLIEGGQP